MIIHLIIGTRPNIVKAAPVYKALSKIVDHHFELVHTGQHFDHLMNDVIFNDLGLSEPAIHLGARGPSHASQTASINLLAFSSVLINLLVNIAVEEY